jgi:protein-tyrosine phosphatase
MTTERQLSLSEILEIPSLEIQQSQQFYRKIKLHEILPGKLYQRGEFKDFPLLDKLHVFEVNQIHLVANLIKNKDHELAEKVAYFHYPIPDNKLSEKDKEILLKAAKSFADSIAFGNAALVHCHAGRNRSALFSALICMSYLEINGKEAIELLREKRPNSLANEHFVKFLEEL